MKWKYKIRDQMSVWQRIFSQSKVNGASYKDVELPISNWKWPTDTYLKRRRSFLLKQSAAAPKVLPVPRADSKENRSGRIPSMTVSNSRVGRAPVASTPQRPNSINARDEMSCTCSRATAPAARILRGGMQEGDTPMNREAHYKIKQLTLGDLVVAITDAALEATEDEEVAHEIASLVLVRLLAASAPETAEYLLAGHGSTSIH